ncbi:MAG TPA: FAD-binding protein [Acidimicrobiia bacterium]|nr:FAD-binding protein [Acidimicrobiia bacterium]
MTSIRAATARAARRLEAPVDVEHRHPTSVEELAETLARASSDSRKVLVWGGGTHQDYGYPVEPDLVVFTDRLAAVIDWEPDDLTVVVEGGRKVADLETQLATRGQTAVLAEMPGPGTVGGALAAGISGYRRGRFGPTRDRILEVTLVTGDGRVVRAGGRVVKNVTGYDLPRLAVGSFGRLGVIVSACLKLWPLPRASATVTLDGAFTGEVYRPLAVLQEAEHTTVYLAGTEEEVSAQMGRLEGKGRRGLAWPQAPTGPWTWSLRVPPPSANGFIPALPTGFVHQVGIGEISFATEDTGGMNEFRTRAEAVGGNLVVTGRPPGGDFEPWGRPPSGLEIQTRLTSAFDPARILNPGRLPGHT